MSTDAPMHRCGAKAARLVSRPLPMRGVGPSVTSNSEAGGVKTLAGGAVKSERPDSDQRAGVRDMATTARSRPMGAAFPSNGRHHQTKGENSVMDTNFHTNAAALIVAAAKKSGLLETVAETLCFIDKHPNPVVGCRACELRDALAGAFDAHICLPAITLESFYGEGFCTPPYSETELTPYLKT